MADNFKSVPNKMAYLKFFILIPVCSLLLLVSVFLTQYVRQKPETRINTEDDELIIQMFNLYETKERKKRTVDVATYKQMGWTLSPAEAKIVFSAYYNCIWERNEAYKQKPHIKAILGLEGQTIKMSCHACFRPDQDPANYDIEWQQLRTQDAVLSYIEPNHKMKISDQKTLVILKVDIVDSGQYFCVQSKIQEYIEIYQLDVIFREKIQLIPESDQKDLLPARGLPKHNLKVFTLWSEWSDCNNCNKLGQRRRVGMCMVSKLNQEKPVEPVDIPIIVLYPDGIPCRSTILPKEISVIKRIMLRKSETIIGNCFMKCPTTPAFITVTDASGKIVETIDAGFYSLKNKPKLPPMVKRKVIYTTTNTKIVLSCPSSSKKKSMIRWQNGSVPLNPFSISRQTHGRIRIDTINRLHIKGLRMSDMAIYSCWVQADLISTTKVMISHGIDPNIHTYITTGGLALTISCVVLVCVCTLCKKARKSSA